MRDDFELLTNLDILFENKNFIYGGGHDGGEAIRMMMSAGIPIESVVDKNLKGGVYGYKIINIDDLYKEFLQNKGKINIVISSRKYFSEILHDIEIRGIGGNLYSFIGVEKSLEMNLNDRRLLKNYKEKCEIKKELKKRGNYRGQYEKCIYKIMETDCPVLIYQAGKMGSKTIEQTLNKYKIDCLHTHCLNPDRIMYKDMQHDYMLCNRLLKMNPIKIITLVREPISRNISSFFEQNVISDSISIDQQVIRCLDDFSLENWPFSWFRKEFEVFTGINIFRYDFDRKHGYMRIKERNIEILCLQMEKMKENVDVLGDFLEIQKFQLAENCNVGENKISGEIYKKVRKDLRIPQYIVDRYYVNNMEMDFFYSNEDKSKFLSKMKFC